MGELKELTVRPGQLPLRTVSEAEDTNLEHTEDRDKSDHLHSPQLVGTGDGRDHEVRIAEGDMPLKAMLSFQVPLVSQLRVHQKKVKN